jgi:hypothetical protein
MLLLGVMGQHHLLHVSHLEWRIAGCTRWNSPHCSLSVLNMVVPVGHWLAKLAQRLANDSICRLDLQFSSIFFAKNKKIYAKLKFNL